MDPFHSITQHSHHTAQKPILIIISFSSLWNVTYHHKYGARVLDHGSNDNNNMWYVAWNIKEPSVCIRILMSEQWVNGVFHLISYDERNKETNQIRRKWKLRFEPNDKDRKNEQIIGKKGERKERKNKIFSVNYNATWMWRGEKNKMSVTPYIVREIL